MLVVSIAYALNGQSNSSTEPRTIQAGLIESGGRPALYFSLENHQQENANYTYTVTYNWTDGQTSDYTYSVVILPTRTFSHSVSLVRPTIGVIVLNLKIFRDEEALTTLIYNQTWLSRADLA